MIGAPALARTAGVPRSVGRLRAAEVYAQALAERLTLLAHADADADAETVEHLGAQLAAVESACITIEETVRPMLRGIDPAIASHVDRAADVAQQRGEAMQVA